MGLGRRTFAPGEVLTASNVMNYLMDQSVMNFAGTAARGSAIGTAVAEGMVTYLNDSNNISVYDGSAWKNIPATIGDSVATLQSTAPGTSGQPFKVAAGLANTSSIAQSNFNGLFWDTATTVTFPSGRFTQSPIVTLTLDSGVTVQWAVLVGAPSTTSFTFFSVRLAATPQLTAVRYIAVQMTTGSGAG